MATARRRPVPPPVWFAAALVLQRMLTRHRLPTAASRTTFGVLTAASGLVAISSVAALARAGTEISPTHPERSTVLVTDGPFRFSRNPVYLALAGILVAHAALRRSVAALSVAVGFIVVMDRTQIPAEEQALSKRFTRAYDSYRQATPRWIGRPPVRR
ncbi:MAG: isoprenylcysteine carboxylmethyltransferase family protein [Microbacteriaceae bacterium]|nr:MAG: isoprenylcysteine carboxylmethyltransferase family protein [Microbacteriaceae bacterium]